MSRRVLLLAHTGRAEAVAAARRVGQLLAAAGTELRVLRAEAAALDLPGAEVVSSDGAARDVELVIVFGGDGTLLRGAELSRPFGAALFGVNLGHVGFLAEAEPEDLDTTAAGLLAGAYHVEERLTVEAWVVEPGGDRSWAGWALNEVALEKADRARMLECLLEIDGRPLSQWGTDGVLVATPTGSTAYAFSAGGPVIWPQVGALVVVPVSAHALFARPLVVDASCPIAIEVLAPSAALLSCDGRRVVPVPPGARVEVGPGAVPVRLARLGQRSFTDRLVAKFGLPVSGWRGRRGGDEAGR